MHPLKSYLSDIKESVQDFAVRVGTSRQTLHRIISGAIDPRPALAKRIVEATGGAVTFEILYRHRACRSGRLARQRNHTASSQLDRSRIRTALSVVVSHMTRKGSPPPSTEIADEAADAVLKIYDALILITPHMATGRIGRSMRPVIDEMLQAYGECPAPAALDQAVRLGLQLYGETGTYPDGE